MMENHRTNISKENLTANLTHSISISADESMIYLKVVLSINDKPFSTEKSFRNNIFGLEEMGLTVESLDNDGKVKRYFGIGETNEPKHTEETSK